MARYTREGFRRKLKKMAPNRKFCADNMCPIATLYLSDSDEDEANEEAGYLDPALVEAIDAAPGKWYDLTPSILLALIGVVNHQDKMREAGA